MADRQSTLCALLLTVLASAASGCGGAQTESGAGAAFLNGADESEYQAGLTSQQAGQTADAERHFKRALAANPNFLSARISLGNLQLAQGRNEEAVATFDEAVTTRPNSVDGQLGAADARVRLGRCEEALPLASRVTAAGGAATPAQRSTAFTIVGRCKIQLKQSDAAESLQQAILTNGSNTDARLALAELLLSSRSAADVVTALARAEEYERKPGALLRIGKLMTAVHQSRRAVTVLTRAQQAAPTDDDVAVALAQAQIDVGDGNLALQTLTEVVGRAPSRLDAQVMMGRAELLADRTEPAKRRAEQVLATDGQNAGAHLLMALLQLGHDDKVSAERSLRAALQAESGLVEARTELAKILQGRAAWGELVDLLEADAERAWAPSIWSDLLLEAYRSGGRADLALPLLSRRAEERGSDPEAHAEVVELALKSPGILPTALVANHAKQAFDRSGGSLTRYRLLLIDALAADNRVKEALEVVNAGLKAIPGNRDLLARQQALRARAR